MIKRLYFTVPVLLFFISATCVRAAVVINEFVPVTSNPNQEWVELYNNGDQSVSLDRWKLDHTGGDAKSFIFNASAVIQPHNFLTVNGYQTALSFSVNGDTIRLFDENNSPADSQSYPGTLGYNNAMGRTVDGGGVWAPCTTATYNTNNNCPQPTPTVTPTPLPPASATATPFIPPSPTNMPAATGVPTPISRSFGQLVTTPAVLGVTGAPSVTTTPGLTPTPADVLRFTISKISVAFVALGIALMGVFVLGLMLLRRITRR